MYIKNKWTYSTRRTYFFKKVKESLENENYILVSNVYIDAHTKFDFICPYGHKSSMNWNNWKTGKRCGICVRGEGIVNGCRQCVECKEWKTIDNFHKNKNTIRNTCKACRKKEQQSIEGSKKQQIRNRRWERSEKGKIFSKKYKISRCMSNSIRASLKGHKNGVHWEDIVGYTLADFKKHISGLFSKNMTWENHGEWHIDHKRPIASFNITSYDCDDFKECWSLSNLQPLWAEDNLKKGSKWNKQLNIIQ